MRETDRFIHDRLPADFCEKISKGEYNRNIYPPFSDREAWEKARQSRYANEIIARADNIEENSVPVLLFSNYSQFNINGNRSEYESPYFRRRANLAYLALAMCLTGDKEKYMPRLMDHLIAIFEEWNWCLPAHIHWKEHGPYRWNHCDLFAAETGMVISLLHCILGEELGNDWQGLPEIIRTKTLDRTVNTALYGDFVHDWLLTEAPMNWTVWCCSNCLFAALLLENDPEKRLFAVKSFLEATSRFINYNPDDGYCPEGPSYYNKANLIVFQTLLLLDKIMPGCADKLFADARIKALAECIANFRMGKSYVNTFSDSQPVLRTDWSRLLPSGKRLNSKPILDMGALQEEIYGACGDYIGTCLSLLFDMPTDIPTEVPAGNPVNFYPGRLGIFRTENTSVSLKGGNNNEPHNHNDLGHFSLFSGNTPVIIDAGVGTYSKINFSDLRYTLWNTRGNGHNAPVFGEYEQISGKEFTATLDYDNANTYRCDLAKAYPAEAGVETFVRTLTLNGDDVTVEDSFTLKKALPVTIRLLTTCTPEVLDDRTIQLGDITLSLENIVCSGTEQMPDLLYLPSKTRIWGNPVTALLLKTDACNYKMLFKHNK